MSKQNKVKINGVQYEQMTPLQMKEAGCFGDVMSYGLNDKSVYRKVDNDAVDAPEYFVDKTSKKRELKILEPSYHEQAQRESQVAHNNGDWGGATKHQAPEARDEADQCAKIQRLYVEADFSAVVLANVTRALFRGKIVVPQAVLHVDKLNKDQHLTPVPSDPITPDKKPKVRPCSHLMTSFVSGYSEPLTKQPHILQAHASAEKGEANTPKVWASRHDHSGDKSHFSPAKAGVGDEDDEFVQDSAKEVEKSSPGLLKRQDLELDPSQNKGVDVKKFLGEVFAFAAITGCLDAVNNINLSNVGVVGHSDSSEGQHTAVVDLGLALGWGFSGQTVDASLFQSAVSGIKERNAGVQNPVTGFENVMPFDRRVFFDLPRLIVPDLFHLDDPDIRAAFIKMVETAEENVDRLKDAVDASFDQVTESSALKGDDLREEVGGFYSGDGENSLANILAARVKDAKQLAKKLAAVDAMAADDDDIDPNALAVEIVREHNRLVMIDFLVSQGFEAGEVKLFLEERRLFTESELMKVEGEITEAVEKVKIYNQKEAAIQQMVQEGVTENKIEKALGEQGLWPKQPDAQKAERAKIQRLIAVKHAQRSQHGAKKLPTLPATAKAGDSGGSAAEVVVPSASGDASANIRSPILKQARAII